MRNFYKHNPISLASGENDQVYKMPEMRVCREDIQPYEKVVLWLQENCFFGAGKGKEDSCKEWLTY